MGSEEDILLPSGSTNWGTATVRAVDYADAASASKGVAAEGLAIADAASAIATTGAAANNKQLLRMGHSDQIQQTDCSA